MSIAGMQQKVGRVSSVFDKLRDVKCLQERSRY